MTPASPPNGNFYVLSGTVPPKSHSYVERQADRDLSAALLEGEYCFVLNSRQMGKSSLSVRTMGKLQELGVRTVFLDLTKIGGSSVIPEQWYIGLASETGRSLGLRKEFLEYWKQNQEYSLIQRYVGALREVALVQIEAPIVLIIDEIDAVKSLSFNTDEFFAAIRESYNRRVQDETMRRLSICLVGSATPSDLITDTRTSPFNIGKRIELKDFTLQECQPLAEGLNRPNATGLVQRAFYWTHGHPYLTQSLCAAIAQDSTVVSASGVDALTSALLFEPKARERNPNLVDVSNRILSSYLDAVDRDEHRSAILDLYGRVLKGRERIADDETDRLVSLLKLAGIVRSEGGRIVLRNRIYECVFDRAWIERSMPDAEIRRQRAAYGRGAVRTMAIAGLIVAAFAALSVYGFRQALRANDNARLTRQTAARLRTALDASEYDIYVAGIQLAQREFENNNVSHTLELLASTANSKYRGPEWDYLDRLCHLDLKTFSCFDGGVASLAFSPDGGAIAVSGYFNLPKILDARTGREIATLTRTGTGVEAGVSSIAFSPGGDRVITSSMDRLAMLWDAKTGQKKLTLKGHLGGVNTCTFSPDGKWIVTGGEDKTARVWNAQTGDEIRCLKGSRSAIFSVAVSPDNRRIAIGNKQLVQIWDANTGKMLLKLVGHKSDVWSVTFSRDGKRIVTGSRDRTAKIWNAMTGKAIVTLKGHKGGVQSVAISPNGDWILTGSDDHTARLWDAEIGRDICTLRGHSDVVCAVAFSPDGKRIATGSRDGSTKIWSAARRENVVLQGHKNAISTVTWAPDGRKIATGSHDNTVKVWDAESGRSGITIRGVTNGMHMYQTVYGDFVAKGFNYCTYSHDGRRFVTASTDGTARLWDAATGKQILVFKGHADNITSVAFSPDDGRIVTGSDDHTARVWDAGTGAPLLTLTDTNSVGSVCFSPDGTRIATGSYGIATLWDATSGGKLLTLKGHIHEVMAVAFSSDGKRIVTADYDKTAMVWNAQTGQALITLKGHNDPVTSAAFSPDGRRIVTGSWDGTAKIWDAATGKELLTLVGHTSYVTAVAFSPDGKQILTGSWDGTARIWFLGPDHFDWETYEKTQNPVHQRSFVDWGIKRAAISAGNRRARLFSRSINIWSV
jgi:WD40 repeat protein